MTAGGPRSAGGGRSGGFARLALVLAALIAGQGAGTAEAARARSTPREKPLSKKFELSRRSGASATLAVDGHRPGEPPARGLRPDPAGGWRSRSGLRFTDGPTLARILSHVTDDPHAASHGVFAAGHRAIGVLDAAWRVMANTHNWELESVVGSRRTVVVEVGSETGWIGGREGVKAGRPITTHVRMVLEGDHVLAAEPVAVDRMPKVLAANVNVPARPRPKLAVKGAITKLLQARDVPRAVAGLAAEHVLLGMPTDAARTNENDWLLARDGSVISYNRGRMSPNWAAWTVTAEDTQRLPRPKRFRTNKSLPEGWLRMSERDIKNSGTTRGHLVAAGERGASMEEAKETFTFTNILPQGMNSNTGPWNGLEKHYRGLAKLGKTVHVFAGGIYGPKPRLIGRGVPVPDAMWKIVVVLEPGETIRNIGPHTRVIAQVVPNEDAKVGKYDDWGQYRTSVAEIERQTGYDFFSNLPRAVGDQLKGRVDTGSTEHPQKTAGLAIREERARQRAAGGGR